MLSTYTAHTFYRYVNKLNLLRDARHIAYEDLQEEFRHFLSDYKDSLNRSTTFRI